MNAALVADGTRCDIVHISSAHPVTDLDQPQKPSFVTKWLARYDRSTEEEERQRLLERLAQIESEADWDKDSLPIDTFEEDLCCLEDESSL